MLAAALTVWTAWFDRALIAASPTPAPIVASAAIAAVYFLLAWLYRSPQRTWAASLIALAGTVHALNFNYFACFDHIGPNWTIALLGHATLAMLAVLCLDRLRGAGEAVRRAIGDPLANSALLSSVLVLPVLTFGRSAGSLWLACCFPWLAAVWLVLAWRNRSVVLFAAHQAALAFAALAAATAWMKHVGWIVPSNLPPAPNLLERIASVRHVVLEPRNLQAYGIALGLLSLVWVVARIIDLRRGVDDRAVVTRPVQRRLVHPAWRGRDAVVGGRLVHSCRSATRTFPQRRFAGPACRRPQRLWPDRMDPHGSPGRNARRDALGKMADRRTGCSAAGGRHAALPDRRPIHRGPGRRLGVAVEPGHRLRPVLDRRLGTGASGRRLPTASRRAFAPGAGTSLIAAPRVARIVLLTTMVLPVLAITFMAAMLQIGGAPPGGPVAKTFFATLGPTLSNLVPLALVIGALVGYALRERSSGYAFSAGLVLEMAVILGYALHTTLAKQPFDATFVVTLIQLFAVTAAVWAIVWLIGRKQVRRMARSTGTPLSPTAARCPGEGQGVRGVGHSGS